MHSLSCPGDPENCSIELKSYLFLVVIPGFTHLSKCLLLLCAYTYPNIINYWFEIIEYLNSPALQQLLTCFFYSLSLDKCIL